MVSNSNHIKVFLYLRRLIKPLCASNILNEYSKSETSYIAQHLLKALENREMKILVINIHSSGQHHSLVSICLHHTKKKSAPLQSTRHPKKRPQGSKAGVRNAIWSSPPRQLCLWFFFSQKHKMYIMWITAITWHILRDEKGTSITGKTWQDRHICFLSASCGLHGQYRRMKRACDLHPNCG